MYISLSLSSFKKSVPFLAHLLHGLPIRKKDFVSTSGQKLTGARYASLSINGRNVLRIRYTS